MSTKSVTRKTGGKPFAGYVRVSDFDSGAGHSPEWQERVIRDTAKFKGDRVVFPVKPDLNVSGAVAADARALGQLLEAVERGEYAGIYVWNTKRFGRDSADVLVNAKRMRDCGAVIVGCEDGVDTRQSGGKMLLGFMAVLAEDELDRISAVWVRARSSAVKRGVVTKAPVGYTKREDGTIEPNEDAPHVREVFRRRARGDSWTSLAAYLDAAGVKPGRGEKWARTSVSKMLRSRTYLGEVRSGEFVNPQAHEAIVSEDEWLAAQRSGTVREKTGKLSSKVLLSGLLRCAGCGNKMQVGRQWSNGKGTERATYYCRYGYNGRCESPVTIRSDALDRDVEERLLDYFESPGPIRDAVRASGRKRRAEESVAEAQDVLDKLLANTRLIAALGDDEYTSAVENAKRDLGIAKADLAEIREQATIIDGLIDGQELTVKVFRSLDVADKRRIVSALLDRVVVRSSKVRTLGRAQIVWRGNVTLDAPDGGFYAPEYPEEQEAATV